MRIWFLTLLLSGYICSTFAQEPTHCEACTTSFPSPQTKRLKEVEDPCQCIPQLTQVNFDSVDIERPVQIQSNLEVEKGSSFDANEKIYRDVLKQLACHLPDLHIPTPIDITVWTGHRKVEVGPDRISVGIGAIPDLIEFLQAQFALESDSIAVEKQNRRDAATKLAIDHLLAVLHSKHIWVGSINFNTPFNAEVINSSSLGYFGRKNFLTGLIGLVDLAEKSPQMVPKKVRIEPWGDDGYGTDEVVLRYSALRISDDETERFIAAHLR